VSTFKLSLFCADADKVTTKKRKSRSKPDGVFAIEAQIKAKCCFSERY
jgi:hypothetical protein